MAFLMASMTIKAISLDDCQQKARDNYPLIKQFGLIEQTMQYSVSNVSKAWLPQLTLNVRATYQSDVTQIPSSLSSMLSMLTGQTVSFQSLPQDQYQAQVELTQILWDGGAVNAQKKMITQASQIEKEQLESQLFALKDRINQLYFGSLLIKEQLVQLNLLKLELDKYIQRIEKLKNSGLADQSKVNQLEIEKLQAEQKEIELKTIQSNYLQVLSAFVGVTIEAVDLIQPEVHVLQNQNLRPELNLFQGQLRQNELQINSLKTSIQPKLGLFIQSGYGRPALNMFSGSFEPFYMGGLRMSWNLSSFYTLNSEIRKVKLASEKVASQKETFLFNQKLQSIQYLNELDKLTQQLRKDIHIVKLHESIKEAENAKLENGVLSITDLIREINLTEAAKQQKTMHEIQLLMTNYQQKNLYNQ